MQGSAHTGQSPDQPRSRTDHCLPFPTSAEGTGLPSGALLTFVLVLVCVI